MSAPAAQLGNRLRAPAPTSSSTIVHLYQGQPVTNSLAIASEFQRTHKNVLQSIDALIEDGTINRLEFKPVRFTDAKGEQRRMIELTERGALIAMPFIGGRNSRAGQVRLVDAFLAMREELAAQPSEWSGTREKVSSGYQIMCEALQEARAEDGKTTSRHHYANEAKLVNWVLFGRFKGIIHDHIGAVNLALLYKVQIKNAIWIARGRTYEQRKEALPAYVDSVRTNHAGIAP